MEQKHFLPVTQAHSDLYLLSKRLMDVVVAAILLALLSPVMLIVWLCVRLDSPGPVLFRQTRVGKNGEHFTFYKFRSMRHNADPEIHKRYVEALIKSQAPAEGSTPNQTMYKLVNDPRITRIGHFLRKTSLDELPQLFNVLRGDMSLVGPRPSIPYEVQAYQEWHRKRLAALPGITGWWQVNGRSLIPFDEMVQMDIDYISQQSILFDLQILFLTIPVVLFGRGAK